MPDVVRRVGAALHWHLRQRKYRRRSWSRLAGEAALLGSGVLAGGAILYVLVRLALHVRF